MAMVLDRFFGRRAWVAALGIMVIGAVILRHGRDIPAGWADGFAYPSTYVEGGIGEEMDFKPGQKLVFSPWLDDVVTSCQIDPDAEAPPDGHMRTAGGKLAKLP